MDNITKTIDNSIKAAGKIFDNIIYGIFPKRCPLCEEAITPEELICKLCIPKIKFVQEPKCKKCGKKLVNDRQEYCHNCSKNNHFFETGISTFEYTEEIRKAIYRFKYHNKRDYGKFFANAIYINNGQEIKGWKADVIMPIPIHYKRRVKRGYNQAEILAGRLGEYINIPINSKCLVRQSNTKPQKDLSVSERKQNLENAFKIVDNVVKYRKVILIDDIYTTGSTIDECAKVLLSAGVDKVYYISLSIGTGI